MIRVRRHERQLPSGKVTTVRQHQRNADVSAGQGGLRPTGEDEWWDHPDAQRRRAGDPEGTWYFSQHDQVMAMHPDGTVHEVPEPAGEDGPDEDEHIRLVYDSDEYRLPAPESRVKTAEPVQWRAGAPASDVAAEAQEASKDGTLKTVVQQMPDGTLKPLAQFRDGKPVPLPTEGEMQ